MIRLKWVFSPFNVDDLHVGYYSHLALIMFFYIHDISTTVNVKKYIHSYIV